MKHGDQKKIADKIGVTSQFINQILNGKRRPSWENAKKIAEAIPGTDPTFWMDATKAEKRKAFKNAPPLESSL